MKKKVKQVHGYDLSCNLTGYYFFPWSIKARKKELFGEKMTSLVFFFPPFQWEENPFPLYFSYTISII